MCKVHDKVCGKAAVELLAEARLLNNVCTARMWYLGKQAKSFYSWVQKQEWCDDAIQFCQSIVTRTEELLDEDAEKCAEYLFDGKEVSMAKQMELELDMFEELVADIDQAAERKQYSKAEQVKSLENHLERWKDELKLHDLIQDSLDVMKPGQFKAFNNRLDVLRKQKKLGYGGWVIFKNVLRRVMGWKPLATKYKVVCVADQIARAEEKLEKLNEEILTRDEFFSDPHKEADEWLENHEQQVVQAGLVSLQQSYICPMCGAESFPGYKGCSCK